LILISLSRISVGVFGTSDVIDKYSKYLDYPHESVAEVVKSGSHGYSAENTYAVVKNVCHEVLKFDFAVAHLQMDVSEEKERVRAVNSCLKVANSVRENSLVLVIAGGKSQDREKPESRPGCFVGITAKPFEKL